MTIILLHVNSHVLKCIVIVIFIIIFLFSGSVLVKTFGNCTLGLLAENFSKDFTSKKQKFFQESIFQREKCEARAKISFFFYLPIVCAKLPVEELK